MRFNKPRHDPQIRFNRVSIEQGRRAVPHFPDLYQSRLIVTVVVHHRVIIKHVGRQHLRQFFPRIRPMRSQLIHQENVLARMI